MPENEFNLSFWVLLSLFFFVKCCAKQTKMSLNKHSLLLIFFNVKVFFQMNEFKGVSNIDDDGDEYPKKNNSIRKDFCLNVADVFLTGIK